MSLILITCLFSSMLNCLLDRCISMHVLPVSVAVTVPVSISVAVSATLEVFSMCLSFRCLLDLMGLHVCVYSLSLSLPRSLSRSIALSVTHCQFLFLSLSLYLCLSRHISSSSDILVHDRSSHLRRLSRGGDLAFGRDNLGPYRNNEHMRRSRKRVVITVTSFTAVYSSVVIMTDFTVF